MTGCRNWRRKLLNVEGAELYTQIVCILFAKSCEFLTTNILKMVDFIIISLRFEDSVK